MSFDLSWSGFLSALPFLLDGLQVTFSLFVLSACVGAGLGCVLASMIMFGPRAISTAATWYVNVFRAVPTILLIFWMFLVMPFVVRFITGDPYAAGGALEAAVVALALAQSSYYCEIIRAGFAGVPTGQRDAGLALGMSPFKIIWLVTLPQAVRNMSPSLISQSIGLFKDTSLVYVVGLHDFLGAATMIGQRDNLLVEFYLLSAITYLTICTAGVALVRALDKRKLETNGG